MLCVLLQPIWPCCCCCVLQAVYTALKETEQRATDLLPLWKVRFLPLAASLTNTRVERSARLASGRSRWCLWLRARSIHQLMLLRRMTWLQYGCERSQCFTALAHEASLLVKPYVNNRARPDSRCGSQLRLPGSNSSPCVLLVSLPHFSDPASSPLTRFAHSHALCAQISMRSFPSWRP